jgi:hypothetical protein
MFEILSESAGNVMGIKVSGKLTTQDYEEGMIPALTDLIKTQGKIRLLCLIAEDFAGWEAGAMWDDAKFFFPHKDDFEKMAIVGAPKWIDWMMKVFAVIMQGEAKTFPADQLPAAWEWIKA